MDTPVIRRSSATPGTRRAQAGSSPRDDRILPVVRWVAAPVVVVLVVAAVILYGFPDRTTEFFAWTIRPTMSALLMGAGYGAGAYFFARVFLSPKWHWVGLYFPAITAFTWVLAFCTILYWDRFNHDHVAFYAWVVLYFSTPILIPILWLLNRRADPGTPDPDDVVVRSLIRAASGLAGVGLLTLAAILVLFPDLIRGAWPWELSQPSARVIGGWLAAPGVCEVLLVREPRWSAWRILVQHQAIAIGLILLAVVRAWSEFNAANPVTWLYVGAMAGFEIALVALLVVFDARRARIKAGVATA